MNYDGLPPIIAIPMSYLIENPEFHKRLAESKARRELEIEEYKKCFEKAERGLEEYRNRVKTNEERSD